ncbi:MlaD family protein [Pseudonocardia pini]|uniref:MlaD family protein n=1 Tax=Pseudonocardia pini TaxID=2758030 RepID=UPI0015F04610|nr:MlaD family protein [Pseudonocardia pini]
MAKVKPEIRDRKRAFVVGIGGLVFVGFVLYFAFNSLAGVPFVPRGYVKAAFDNVDSLQVRDLVRQNSKRIGSVDSIEFEDGEAVVTMKLDDSGYQAFSDASAVIWDQSALGTKFVELQPGTPAAGPLGEDEVIGQTSRTSTESSADLYQVLDTLDPDTRASAQRMLGEVGAGTVGHAGDLTDFFRTSPDLLGDLGTVSDALTSDQADLPALLRSADDLAGRFEGRAPEIASLLRQTNETLQAVSVDSGGALDASLERAPATVAHLQTALDALDEPLGHTQSAVSTLEPGAASLAAAENDLRGVLTESPPVLDRVPGVADLAEPAVEDLTDTVADARPLADRVAQALDDAETPLSVLQPYGPEIGQLFVRLASFVSMGGADGNRYAYINANVGADSVTTGLVDSCNVAQNNYPKPGEASFDTLKEGLPPGVPCLNQGTDTIVPLENLMGGRR